MTTRRVLCAMVLLTACDTKPSTPPDAGGGASEPTTTTDDDEGADDDADADTEKRAPPVEQVLKIEGKLPEAQIEKQLQDHTTDIQACYDEALQNPNQEHLKGAIVVRFVVSPAGEVASPEIELSEFDDKPTETCIAAVVGSFAFGKQKAASIVHLPFYMNNF